MLSGEATNTNFIVSGLTRSGHQPTIYHTRGKHVNYYTTNVVDLNKCFTIYKVFLCSNEILSDNYCINHFSKFGHWIFSQTHIQIQEPSILILIPGNLSLIKRLTFFFFNKCTVTTIYSNLFPLFQKNFTTGLPGAVMLISL